MNPNIYVDDMHAMTVRQAYERAQGVTHSAIRKRLQRGWSLEDAVTTPMSQRKRRPRRRLSEIEMQARRDEIAASLAMWADWRGPVDYSPLVSPL